MMKKEKKEYLIKAVERAVRVIDELAECEEGELGISEIARRVNLHKNNVFRILATLETLGYVEQNKETENYRLSPKFILLGESLKRKMNAFEEKKKVVDRIAEETGESAYLCFAQDGQIFHVYGKTSLLPVRVEVRSDVAVHSDAHVVGKVIGKSEVVAMVDRNSVEDAVAVAFSIPERIANSAVVVYVPSYRAKEEVIGKIREVGIKVVNELVEKLRST